MATVQGGFWENNGGTYNWPISVTSQRRRMIAYFIDRDKQSRSIMSALNGVAPGALATEQYRRVASNTEELGGARAVGLVTVVSRVTTAADVTDLAADVYTYGGLDSAVNVPNLDGNPLGTR